jgi:hypothetical protein
VLNACAGICGYQPIGSVGRENNLDLVLIAARDCRGGVATILWIIASLCVIGGIVTLIGARCSTTLS